MHVTILFGDRERKSSADEIAQRAREAVESVLGLARTTCANDTAQLPVWHSVALQFSCAEEAEYARLLSAIEKNCAQRSVSIMGVRRT